jgi:DNA-directed RNA polymerase subunit F
MDIIDQLAILDLTGTGLMSVCMVILKWRSLLHILTWTLESLLIQWQEFIQILSSDNRSLTYLNELFQSVDHKDKNLSSIYPLVSKLYSIAAIQPLSTAEVERLFSQVASNIKTEALSKILNIKYNCDLYTVKIIHV